MPKVATKKKTVIQEDDNSNTLNEILDRLRHLEDNQATLVKGLRWIGEEIKPIFGIGGIGAYFIEVADKLGKKS